MVVGVVQDVCVGLALCMGGCVGVTVFVGMAVPRGKGVLACVGIGVDAAFETDPGEWASVAPSTGEKEREEDIVGLSVCVCRDEFATCYHNQKPSSDLVPYCHKKYCSSSVYGVTTIQFARTVAWRVSFRFYTRYSHYHGMSTKIE